MRPHLVASLILAAVVTAGPALSAPAKGKPDFAGVWMIQDAYFLGKPLKPAPKLTEAVKAQAERRAAAQKGGYVREVAGMLCGQNGGPNMYQVRSPFEIFSGFGRVTLIFETEMNNQPRTIYMNETAHSPDVYPSYNGHSIGHWEGRTLVVDTVGFTERGQLMGPVPRTTTTHLKERFTWSSDGQTMTDQITVEDPKSLVEPWTTKLVFDRKPNTEERFEVWCDADLQAFNRLDLPKLKDADPEIALILDGAFTDPAVDIAKVAGR
jgi:hypothetical protein